jgi:hypothetical protein
MEKGEKRHAVALLRRIRSRGLARGEIGHKTRWHLFFCTALVAASLQSASADTLKYDGAAYGGYVGTSGLANVPQGVTSSPAAGGFMMQNITNPGGSFVAWCLDIFDYLNTSAKGATYSLTPGSTFYSQSSTVTALERLASQHLDSLVLGNDRIASGAFQLAAWEIVNETSGAFGLGNGSFQVASADGGAIALANSWLSTLNSGPITKTLNVWRDVNGGTQDLAVFAPIPEPEIYVMMLAGLGLMGFVARRRRPQSSAS